MTLPGTTASRKKAAQIKKLLRQRDSNSIEQAVELARALDDPAVYEVLLDGVRYEKPSTITVSGSYKNEYTLLGRVVPNAAFTATKAMERPLEAALLAVLTAAHHPIVEQITDLTVGYRSSLRKSETVHAPLDWLAELPNLQRLELHTYGNSDLAPLAASSVTDLRLVLHRTAAVVPAMQHLQEISFSHTAAFEPGGSWPALTTIDIVSTAAQLDVSALAAGAPKLARIKISRLIGDIEGFPALTELELGAVVSVRDCPRLARLVMIGNARPNGPCTLRSLPKLEELVLGSPSHHHIGGVQLGEVDDLPSLKRVELRRVETSSLGFVERATRLQCIKIDAFGFTQFNPPPVERVEALNIGSSALRDLGTCADLPNLSSIGLQGVTLPLSLERLSNAKSLHTIDLSDSPGITDISPLISLPNLSLIGLYGSGVTDVPPEFADVAVFEPNPNVNLTLRSMRMLAAARGQTSLGANLPVPEEQRSQWLDVLAYLSRPPTTLNAVDLASTLNPTAIEFLLSKVSTGKTDKLSLRKPFDITDPALGATAVSRLLHVAPADSVAALKLREVEVLNIEGSSIRSYARPIELQGFTGLRHVSVSKISAIEIPDFGSTAIESLSLHASIIRLGPLPASLTRMKLARSGGAYVPTESEFSSLTTSNLRSLSVDSGFRLQQLVGSSTLTRLICDWWDPADSENAHALTQLPLRELHLEGFTSIPKPLLVPSTLERLVVSHSYVQRLAEANPELAALIETPTSDIDWNAET